MHVVAHEPSSWFLLEESSALYLDVNCSHSFVSFSMLIQLTEQEAERYRINGTGFLSSLAAQVQEHSFTTYRERNLSALYEASVNEAISQWRANNASAGRAGA
jgi:hypothetical protein